MVQIFSKSGFREESYAQGFQVQVSRAFIEKHGKGKTEAICRQILTFLDRPFDKGRVQDRYLDWLTGGCASALSL